MEKRFRKLNGSLFSAFLLVLSLCSFAAAQDSLTIEWMYSAEGKEVDDIPKFTWLMDGSALLYDKTQPDSLRGFEKLFPESGERKMLFKEKTLRKSLMNFLEADSVPEVLDWPEQISQSGELAVFIFQDDLFILDLIHSRFSQITRTSEPEKSPRFSPDGKKLAFVRENNLFFYDLTEEREYQLTFDGTKTLLNGTLSWVYWEEIFGRHDIAYWWSPDSRRIAYLQSDESVVSVMHYVDFMPYTPRVITQRYPKAGQVNPEVRVGVVTIAAPETRWLDFSQFPYEYIIRVKWLPSGRTVAVQTMNRMQTRLDLFLADPGTGSLHRILEETDPGWVNIHDDLYFYSDRDEFLWASERDGFAHLYRYDLSGKLINQVTRGKWSIRSSGGGVSWVRQALVGVDENANWIYYIAQEKSPLERHLYRIRPDGSEMNRLSVGDGFHSVTFRDDGEYYFDGYDSVNRLPSLSLYNNQGQKKSVVMAAKTEAVAGFDLQYPHFFEIPARDGLMLPASLLKPADFDSTKKYPVIFYVYGGPSAPLVEKDWSYYLFFENILVRNGFLVARVDNRSAMAFSKTLENTVLENLMGRGELNDLVDAAKWVKSLPYVDPGRIGVWGWSGGGNFTLLAMTRSREFKAGIAVAPVSDFRFYDTKWTEYAMKSPQVNPEGYERSSMLNYAPDLHGRLMMVHGTYDDNVHIQNTWAFADILIKNGIMFDMMIYPMRKHGIRDDAARIHLFHKMLEFWKNNL